MRTGSAFLRVLAAIGMRLGVVVVPVGVIMRVAAVTGVLMMPERHALTGRHRRHALKRHDERNHDGEQTGELQKHGGIVADELGVHSTTGFQIGPDL